MTLYAPNGLTSKAECMNRWHSGMPFEDGTGKKVWPKDWATKHPGEMVTLVWLDLDGVHKTVTFRTPTLPS